MYVTYISIATIGLNGAHLHMLTSGVNALFMIYLLIIYLSIFSVWWYACQIITLLLGYYKSMSELPLLSSPFNCNWFLWSLLMYFPKNYKAVSLIKPFVWTYATLQCRHQVSLGPSQGRIQDFNQKGAYLKFI